MRFTFTREDIAALVEILERAYPAGFEDTELMLWSQLPAEFTDALDEAWDNLEDQKERNGA